MKALLAIHLLFASHLLAQPPAWKGEWIMRSADSSVKTAPLFRFDFTVERAVQKATLYVTGLGYHITTLNGQAVTDAVLEQGFTCYDRRLLYNTYDVTRLVGKGSNALGIELGNSWFNLQSHSIWYFDRLPWRGSPRVLLNLHLVYKDGTKDTIATGPHWQTSDGGSRFNSLLCGEIYDARMEQAGWNMPGFDDSGWQNALPAIAPASVLTQQVMPPVRVIRKILPIKLLRSSDNFRLYDMGVNFAGVVRLRIKSRRGDTITIRHAERLTADGTPDLLHNAGQLMVQPGEPGFQTDQYICKSDDWESYTPRFTYHGFRYVALTGSAGSSLSSASVEGLFYSTDFKRSGNFRSSDTVLNKLYAAAIQSYQSNFISIPTDCPQREKMGWLADAWVACEVGLWNFDAASGYRKFLADIRDVQLPDGQLPGIAPTRGIGYRWIDPADPDFGPGWGSALPLITWDVYRHTGDTGIIKENYSACMLYADWLVKRARQTGYLYTTGLGDFLAIEGTPKTITSTALLYRDLVVLSKMAGVIGDKAAVVQYAGIADRVKAAFNNRYFDSAQGCYQLTTLTGLGTSIVTGLCPANAQAAVAAQLAAEVRKRRHRADFGVMGTRFVLSALSDNGYVDDAFQLLTNTDAGWGRWIAQGATTLWEGWEPGDQSYNHVFFGDFAAWYYRSLAGIQLDDAYPGFQSVTLQPKFPAGLNTLSVRHRTRFGELGISWKKRAGRIQLRVTVPDRTSARLALPGAVHPLRAGVHRFSFRP